jgi:glycosyltransferase involved in cell wall biosynthesis
MDLSELRVAIVHEWPVVYAGSEQVVAGMLEVLPQAELYVLVHDPEKLKGTPLEGVPTQTSFIQSLPGAKRWYRSYLPLLPLAVEQFDLRSYDLVISSSHAVAKGAITRADQLHISYVHTPMRYAWDFYHDYLTHRGMDRRIKRWLARLVLHYVRIWDAVSASRVDSYLTSSRYVARRIWSIYRRPARVICPPVNVTYYRSDLPREEFYVSVSRFVPYKRMDLIVDAFTRLGKPIVVIGEGPDFAKVKRRAGPNVRLLGYQPDKVVADYLQRAKAFVFAAEEDFGIVPVEAQAAGCPVIAYAKGGALETVIGWPRPDATGVFFEHQQPESLIQAVVYFEAHSEALTSDACRRNAERFGQNRFCQEFKATVEELWETFQRGEKLY